KGMSDEQGLENCAIGLKRVAPIAEKYKVTVCMELLNSKVNHKDYQCDYSKWGVELCKRVGSERFKLLYDIYHMQIMEGDLCATIKANHQYFAHYHTGGVPGRNEIDDTQEIHYPRVMEAIMSTGYKGFVAQEFIPKRPDAIASLRQGVQICDVWRSWCRRPRLRVWAASLPVGVAVFKRRGRHVNSQARRLRYFAMCITGL